MSMEAGVPRRIGATLLLALSACSKQGTALGTRAPTLEKQAQESPALTELCQSSQTLQVLGPGPHGEPQVPQFVQCSSARVHVSLPTMEQEWLFVRDTQDSKRLFGYLVLHRRQAIVRYPGTQLAIEGVAQDWDDLRARLAGGLQSLKSGIEAKALLDPELRFPGYRIWNFYNWSQAKHAPPKGHHHGPGGHHHGPGGHSHKHGEQEPGGHHHGPGGHHHGPGGHSHE